MVELIEASSNISSEGLKDRIDLMKGAMSQQREMEIKRLYLQESVKKKPGGGYVGLEWWWRGALFES